MKHVALNEGDSVVPITIFLPSIPSLHRFSLFPLFLFIPPSSFLSLSIPPSMSYFFRPFFTLPLISVLCPYPLLVYPSSIFFPSSFLLFLFLIFSYSLSPPQHTISHVPLSNFSLLLTCFPFLPSLASPKPSSPPSLSPLLPTLDI